MAITSAALQAELGSEPTSPRVIRQLPDATTTIQKWYVSGGSTYPGRVRLIATTASDNAATQATTVRNALLE